MIYAISDIHGCIGAFEDALDRINLSGLNRLILLGDYIDYGPGSGQVLRRVYELQQKYGNGKVIVLMGNHEDALLGWLRMYRNGRAPKDILPYDSWIKYDSEDGYKTFKTLVTEEQMEKIRHMERKASFIKLNTTAAEMIMTSNGDLIRWMESFKTYYKTDSQIFVHAGVDEDAGEEWEHGTGRGIFLGKYPAATGRFCKTIIAGHVGSASVAGDKDFHDIYYDGMSHYYIDGTVYAGGKLNVLGYDEKNRAYYQIEPNGMREIG
ncbi:MAG: metallophosphoesterase [Lachnospiraceae bacterium]|nr:metallophosphoesterase [Lachnospiraceae bacterium]